MLVCQFCGQPATVDSAGYCTNCRNYRGVPGQQPGYPTSYPPAEPTGYQAAPPTSYPPAPATGYPAPGYPGAGAPISAPANYAGVPSAPQQQRSRYLMPIIAVCSVLALFAVSIIVVVSVGHGGNKDKPTPPLANGFDQCLVGKWRVVDYTVQLAVEGGQLSFTASELNESLDIQADGSVTEDYGTASKPTVLVSHGGTRDYKFTFSGTATYKMRSANDTLTFTTEKTDIKMVTEIDGVEVDTGQDVGSDDPDPNKYSCTGTTLTQTASEFTSTAKKTS
jgi:hypothetical protein